MNNKWMLDENGELNGQFFVKPWRLMELEFGLNHGHINNLLIIWTKTEERMCPSDRIIEIKNNRWLDSDGIVCPVTVDILVGPAFKWGDPIEVRDLLDEDWEPGFFCGIVPGANYAYSVTRKCSFIEGTRIEYVNYKYARHPKEPEIEITVKMNGKIVTLSDVSAETLLKLRGIEK